ncbi:MAG: ATP:cob(I)alamin adenosyltransferase [Alphaproteobacteria bacterium]|nr:ATP:cob(I)alamin adenosyltransferase [Alphaproteobacteria bacterium]
MALITTKAGDTGMTQLNPDRIASKTHPVIAIMGNLDELSCALGMEGDRFDSVQTFLSELMGYLYYKTLDENRLRGQVEILEEYITSHNNSLPPWFVNPRGAVSLARAVCRRAERSIVEFAETERTLSESERYMPLANITPIIQYLNRLSDYLFVKSFERVQTDAQLFRDELATQLPLSAVA